MDFIMDMVRRGVPLCAIGMGTATFLLGVQLLGCKNCMTVLVGAGTCLVGAGIAGVGMYLVEEGVDESIS